MGNGSRMGTKVFKEIFCERFGCSASEYAERALGMSLYPHARILAPVLRKLQPGYFSVDLRFLEYLGKTPDIREAEVEIMNFSEANRMDRSLLRSRLRIRVSGRRAARLARHSFRDGG
jgi:hypothetical protein